MTKRKSWKGFNLIKAKDYFLNLLNTGIKEELNLKENEAPTREQLKNLGHGNFISMLYAKKIKYTDLLKEAELVPNCDLDKWSSLDLEKAVNYLQKLIKSNAFEKFGLPKGIAPTEEQLKEIGHQKFIFAIYKRDFTSNWQKL